MSIPVAASVSARSVRTALQILRSDAILSSTTRVPSLTTRGVAVASPCKARLQALHSAPRSQVDSRSTSNSTRVPQVDYELFHEPLAEEHKVHDAIDANASYAKPTIADILRPVMTEQGFSRGREDVSMVAGSVSVEGEAKAFEEVKQMLALGEVVGRSDGLFESAARVALQNRGCEAALVWLRICPHWRPTTPSKAKDEILLLANAACNIVYKDPRGCHAILAILLDQGWHGDTDLHADLKSIVNALYLLSRSPGGVEDLCSSIVQRTARAQIRGKRSHRRPANRRRFETRCFNSALFVLTSSRQYQRALQLMKSSQPRATKWSPAVSLFHYDFFLKKCLEENDGRTLAEDAQAALISKAKKLKRMPPNYGFGGELHDCWTFKHVKRLIWMGKQQLRTDTESKDIFAVRDATYSDGQQADFSAPHDRDTVELTRMLQSGQVKEAKACLLSLIESIQSHQWDYNIECLARYQAALTLSLPQEAAGRLGAPEDAEIQNALNGLEASNGLWEYAYLWLLTKSGRFSDALRYYLATFRELEWLPTATVQQALGDSAQGHTGSIICSRSSHLAFLISHSIVGSICRRHFQALSETSVTLQMTRLRLDELESCYSAINSAWRRTQTQQATLETDSTVSHLHASFFHPWLRTFGTHYNHLDAWGLAKVPSADGISDVVGKLDIFKGIASGAVPTAMSSAAFRSLQVMLDLQSLRVVPLTYTYARLMHILANDVHNCWPLLEHVARSIGMTAEGRTETNDVARAFDIESYALVLDGFLTLRGRQGGPKSAIPYALHVRDWLHGKTDHAVELQSDLSGSEIKFSIEDLEAHPGLNRALDRLRSLQAEAEMEADNERREQQYQQDQQQQQQQQ